ncbi:MAG: LexA family transcriptional regulator [Bacteroidales bacterium]|jgi:transcriptional regulator with XRE-family HTH domain|nr:LexA family transcriptional regulator [Bacteroidales bacterium]MBQ5957880.1 LexA family transcriptional regulator [Bacteroidales bacterium]
MFFSSNIKFLRKHRGRTQDDVAFALNMKRSTLSGYENEVSEPNLEALVAFSKYFNIAIDTLVKTDLSAISEGQLSQLERGFDVHLKGSNLRVLATTVAPDNNENIELVTEKAKAGYATGFADPEYIKVLPTFSMPFLSRERKYRTFQISGDSMLPIPDKSYVTGEYVLDWTYIQTGKPYIILTQDDGIVFKIVENKLEQEGRLTLSSLNPLYRPFDLAANDIKEVWKFVHYISSEMPEQHENRLREEQLLKTVQELQKKVEEIQLKLNL